MQVFVWVCGVSLAVVERVPTDSFYNKLQWKSKRDERNDPRKRRERENEFKLAEQNEQLKMLDECVDVMREMGYHLQVMVIKVYQR